MDEALIFEKSRPGRTAVSLPETDLKKEEIEKFVPAYNLRKTELGLPQVSELDLVRHFTRLSQKNMSIDTNFYPLGSCTMKYNPKINETLASLPHFCGLHPYQPLSAIQGILHILYETGKMLSLRIKKKKGRKSSFLILPMEQIRPAPLWQDSGW